MFNQSALNSRQIGAHLNERGVTCWRGKRLHPEIACGVTRKACLKRERIVDARAALEI